MIENNNSKKPKLLSVEDMQDTVEGLYTELELYYGINISTATTYEIARDKLAAENFNLILLDMKFTKDGEMHDDAGQQLILELRRRAEGELNRSTGYILFTAQDLAVQQLSERLHKDEASLVLEGRQGLYGKVMSPTQMADIVAKIMGVSRRDLRTDGNFE